MCVGVRASYTKTHGDLNFCQFETNSTFKGNMEEYYIV